jgi:hemerythrin-like domain-containing protein
METSIQSLSGVHDGLGRLFEDHQLALIRGDLEGACQLLAQFADGIRAHIRHEEDVLLPVYEERVKATRVGDPETLRDEHRQIDEALRKIEARTTELRQEGGTREGSILRLLEEQYRFKRLLRHHNDREDRSLYPLLDAACSLDERRDLLRAGHRAPARPGAGVDGEEPGHP